MRNESVTHWKLVCYLMFLCVGVKMKLVINEYKLVFQEKRPGNLV